MSDHDDFVIDPLDSLMEDTNFGQLPVTPDGKFTPATEAFEPDPIPEATPETFICLRGPCRYYVEQKTHFGAGNVAGSLDHVPVMVNRRCSVIYGYEIVLTDEIMYDCNKWDPDPDAKRASRQNDWINANPLVNISKYVKRD